MLLIIQRFWKFASSFLEAATTSPYSQVIDAAETEKVARAAWRQLALPNLPSALPLMPESTRATGDIEKGNESCPKSSFWSSKALPRTSI